MVRRLHDGTADTAGAMRSACIESGKNLGQLRFDVAHRNSFQIQTMSAVLAIPGKSIQLLRTAAPFNDDPDAACGTLRRVGHVRRQQKDLALANRYVGDPAVLHRFEQHIPLQLEEEFFARVVVIILARIGPANGHDYEGAVLKQQLVADRRLEQLSILFDPALQIEGWG